MLCSISPEAVAGFPSVSEPALEAAGVTDSEKPAAPHLVSDRYTELRLWRGRSRIVQESSGQQLEHSDGSFTDIAQWS